MAWAAAAAPYVSAGVSMIGSLTQSKAQKGQGREAERQAQQAAQNELVAAEFEAKQADYMANQAIAISHREAYEHRKASALLASKALAIAAGSGASSSDASVVSMIGDIYAEGAYRSALAMYEGEETSRSYKISASARRIGGKSSAAARTAEGKSIANASNISSFSTLLNGASSMLDLAGTWGK